MPRSSTTPNPARPRPQWSSFEFANSQLLEFRYHDALPRCGTLAPDLRRTSSAPVGGTDRVIGRALPARDPPVSCTPLFIDVNELTDRAENALKLVGDIYAARLLDARRRRASGIATEVEAPASRTSWRRSDDIYRFAVEQVAISRGQFLELTVVLILILELILFMIGVMK